MTKLPGNGTYSVANSIAVQGADVYICGKYYSSPDFKHYACYWKNGVVNTITGTAYDSEATSIVINGADIHIAGNYYYDNVAKPTATYYKNGTFTKLTTNPDTRVRGMIIVGSDVYIAGDGNVGASYIYYWKNGVATLLNENRYPKCIAVQGSDIYVGGSTARVAATNSGGYPAYWKNDAVTALDLNISSGVTGMVLVSK